MTTTTRTERDQETRPTSTAEPVEHYEVVDGQIVDEPPLGARDGWITSEIGEALVIFNAGKQLGKKYEEMLFILADEPRLRRRPDLAFVTAERWPGDKPAPSSAGWNVIPDLAVEVIGPTDPMWKIRPDRPDRRFNEQDRGLFPSRGLGRTPERPETARLRFTQVRSDPGC